MPILVFLGLSVLELGPMYATDRRQTDRRQTNASLNASARWGQMHNKVNYNFPKQIVTTSKFDHKLRLSFSNQFLRTHNIKAVAPPPQGADN